MELFVDGNEACTVIIDVCKIKVKMKSSSQIYEIRIAVILLERFRPGHMWIRTEE